MKTVSTWKPSGKIRIIIVTEIVGTKKFIIEKRWVNGCRSAVQ